MRLLAVPNWSFGPASGLLPSFRATLEALGVAIHYVQGDVDHNRTVTAFSGESDQVVEGLRRLMALAATSIDMNEHRGVHPRIGALDVCPIIPLTETAGGWLDVLATAEWLAQDLAARYDLPVFLYERSERGRHEGDLPTLRKGGFEGLFGRELVPDFGPPAPHPTLGATILGVRDFLIAFNIDLKSADPAVARAIARGLRDARQEGDTRLLGVRALGFPLASRGLSQVSLNVTLPDATAIDPIIAYVAAAAAERAIDVHGTELIGVIREKDLPTSTLLQVDPAQVVAPD